MVATLAMTLTGNDDARRRRYTQREPMSVDPDAAAPLCECGKHRRQKQHGGYRSKCWTFRSNSTDPKRRWGRMSITGSGRPPQEEHEFRSCARSLAITLGSITPRPRSWRPTEPSELGIHDIRHYVHSRVLRYLRHVIRMDACSMGP
jgi:hypothetical protein